MLDHLRENQRKVEKLKKRRERDVEGQRELGECHVWYREKKKILVVDSSWWAAAGGGGQLVLVVGCCQKKHATLFF